jgi:hypothetical protein
MAEADDKGQDQGPTVEEQLATAKAENASLKTRVEAVHETFRALGIDPANPQARREPPEDDVGQPAAPAGGGLSPDVVARISAATGYDAQTVQAYYPIFAAFLGEIASPALQALAGVADRVDLVDTTVELPEKMRDAGFKKRVEAERQARIRRGDFRSRKEIAGLLAAQDADTPAAREAAKSAFDAKVKEEVDRQLGQTAATTEGGTAEKAGPAAGKGAGAPASMETFRNLPANEREAAIGPNTPI